MKKRAILAAASLVGFAGTGLRASPIIYTDTQGDSLGSTNGGRDIVSTTIDNSPTTLSITIELDPTTTTNASGTETPANIATSTYNYAIGITSGSGGDTSASADHGNPYSRAISFDSTTLGGMTDFIGIFGAGGAGTVASPYTSYGFNDYVYTASKWTVKDTVASGQPISATGGDASANTITLSVPLADFTNLNTAAGSTFGFDVFSTGNGAGQTAYDSLANPSPTQTPATYSSTAQYNATVIDNYTVQVPEPTSLSLVAVGVAGLLRRRRSTDTK